MSVIIGVDPHKATHTAVAIDPSQAQLSALRGDLRRGGEMQQIGAPLAGANLIRLRDLT